MVGQEFRLIIRSNLVYGTPCDASVFCDAAWNWFFHPPTLELSNVHITTNILYVHMLYNIYITIYIYLHYTCNAYYSKYKQNTMHITLTIQTHPLWQGSVRALPTPTGFNRPKEPSNCRLTFRHLRAGCGKTMCIYIYIHVLS